MAIEKGTEIAPAKGKLGVLLVGLGAVSTTLSRREAFKAGVAEPIGQPDADGHRSVSASARHPRAEAPPSSCRRLLEQLVFGAWDIFSRSANEAALHAGVLDKDLLAQL
jgi:myo-inositol-1-phosphate synthase